MPDTEVKDTMVKLPELFLGSAIDDDAVLVRKTPLVDREAVGDTMAGKAPPSVVTKATKPSRHN